MFWRGLARQFGAERLLEALLGCATSRATINVPPDLCYERFWHRLWGDSLPITSIWISEHYGYIAAGGSFAHSGPSVELPCRLQVTGYGMTSIIVLNSPEIWSQC